jgi:DivIVA domain-containing protein
MPLTPTDVHNIAFKKPPIGKRGYDAEQVDAFLDELEQELIRLIEENNELRARVERGGAPPGGGADPRLSAELGAMKAQLDMVQRDKAAAEKAARAVQAELEQVHSQGGPVVSGDGEQQALRVLAMAQRTADNHVGDARREADKLLSDARSTAEQVTGEAAAKANALERDTRQRHQAAMDGLDAKRTALHKHIEQLKAFEREYRTGLTSYLDSQLRDLDGRRQSPQLS